MMWIAMPFRRTLDFAGRSRRREYWPYLLLWLILFSGFTALDITFNLGGAADGSWIKTSDEGGIAFNIAFGTTTLIFTLVTFLTGLSLGVRRLHDLDKSGWMILIGIIPLLGWFYLLAIFTMAGTPGPNRYGPDPTARVESQIFS